MPSQPAQLYQGELFLGLVKLLVPFADVPVQTEIPGMRGKGEHHWNVSARKWAVVRAI